MLMRSYVLSQPRVPACGWAVLSSQQRTAAQATQAAEEDGAQDDKAERSAAWASLALVPMDVATMAIIVIVILNRLLGAIKSNSQTESIVGGIANMEWDDPSTDPRIKSMFYLSKLEVKRCAPTNYSTLGSNGMAVAVCRVTVHGPRTRAPQERRAPVLNRSAGDAAADAVRVRVSCTQELSSITSSKSFYDTLCLTALLTLLLRIIIATNCHPRLAILTGTVYHSGDDMCAPLL
jgi:hypothetical protein